MRTDRNVAALLLALAEGPEAHGMRTDRNSYLAYSHEDWGPEAHRIQTATSC